MNIQKRIISRKHARAFLNMFFQNIDEGQIVNLVRVCNFLAENKGLRLFFRLSLISTEKKVTVLKKILAEHDLNHPWDNLVELLAKTKRIFLFSTVSFYIQTFYMELVKKIEWKISSSYPLESDQKKSIEKFLAGKTNNTAKCMYTLDKNLISGVRIQSKDLLWEYSVCKSLRSIKRIVRGKEGL